MNKQNCTLKITINVDMNSKLERGFTRAVLLGLNVLHAQTRPHKYLREILDGGRIRGNYEANRQRDFEREKKLAQAHVPQAHVPIESQSAATVDPGANAGYSESLAAHPALLPALPNHKTMCECHHVAAVHAYNGKHCYYMSCKCQQFVAAIEQHISHITEHKFERPNIIWRIKKIVERRMPLPIDSAPKL